LEQLTTGSKERKETSEHVHGYPSIQFDAEEFWHFVENYDLSDDQKREYLETVWSIIIGFVDLGFGIHPIQAACGKLTENFSKTALTAPNGVYLPHNKDTNNLPE
jgi:hypothetical protein